jgi:hypothetical protein
MYVGYCNCFFIKDFSTGLDPPIVVFSLKRLFIGFPLRYQICVSFISFVVFTAFRFGNVTMIVQIFLE